MRNQNILIADPEPHIVWMLKRFLQRSGHRVITALNGEQALSLIRHDIPDIIICAVHMPKMSGLEFYTVLKQLPQFHGQIIMLAAEFDRELRKLFNSTHDFVLLEGPFSMRKLDRHIKQFIRQQNNSNHCKDEASNVR